MTPFLSSTAWSYEKLNISHKVFSTLYLHLLDFSENSAGKVNLLQPTILMQYTALIQEIWTEFRNSQFPLTVNNLLF